MTSESLQEDTDGAVVPTRTGSDLKREPQYSKAPENQFSSKMISMRAQKKILGKMSSRNVAKHFISDTASRLLDNFHRLLKEFYSKKEAEKVIKNIIKMVIKLGVLDHNNQLSSECAKKDLQCFQRKFKSLCLTVISFHQVQYSYDRTFLQRLLEETKQSLLTIVRAHLSDKSMDRVNMAFDYVAREEFCDAVFKVNGDHAELAHKIVADLDRLIDES